MKKLKTLKDFKWQTYLYNDKEGKVLKFYNDLREEAVKWVKNFEETSIITQAFIRDFFNLEEEDLE